MEMLTKAGIAVAPWVLIDDTADTLPDLTELGDRLVVKLADVAHRTEHDAVRVGVSAAEVPAAMAELRAVAARDGFATVAVQAMITGHGEAFVGVRGRTGLGAVTMVGLGGVLVEVTRRLVDFCPSTWRGRSAWQRRWWIAWAGYEDRHRGRSRLSPR